MLLELVAHAIQFVIQTAFLLLGLWIMIKIQKLEYNFLGLVGAAAAASVLEMILDPLIGYYISTPVICLVLCFCVAKATHTTHVFDIDVIFTVAVGYALVFCMNLFLIGALMDDLMPSAKRGDELDATLARMDEEYAARSGTNWAMVVSLETDAEQGSMATPEEYAQRGGLTNSPKPAAEIRKASPKGGNPAKGLLLKGVTVSGDKSLATILSGTRTYAIGLNETISLRTPGGVINVRCEQVDTSSAVLSIDGERVTLELQ